MKKNITITIDEELIKVAERYEADGKERLTLFRTRGIFDACEIQCCIRRRPVL